MMKVMSAFEITIICCFVHTLQRIIRAQQQESELLGLSKKTVATCHLPSAKDKLQDILWNFLIRTFTVCPNAMKQHL